MSTVAATRQKRKQRTRPAARTKAHGTGKAKATKRVRKRLPRDERERAIVREAVRFFAERGFKGDTRELARRLEITQPLLYRYFPNKQAVIERVYQEVFLNPWNPEWEVWLSDRSKPLRERLVLFYQDYTRKIMNYEWIRLFLFSGLEGLEMNRRYLKFMRDRIWFRVIDEVRVANRRPPIDKQEVSETELELVWAVIASIFYIGVRQFVFGFKVPEDMDAVVEDKVKAFLEGAPAAMAAPARSRSCLRKPVADL